MTSSATLRKVMTRRCKNCLPAADCSKWFLFVLTRGWEDVSTHPMMFRKHCWRPLDSCPNTFNGDRCRFTPGCDRSPYTGCTGNTLKCQRQSVNREQVNTVELSDQSIEPLAQRLQFRGPSPSDIALTREAQQQVRQGLEELGETDREILVLRFLEQRSPAEIGAILGITPGAVRLKQLRALKRLQKLLSHF
jgi:RNA polymerase sigma factor (sigma-70 family)